MKKILAFFIILVFSFPSEADKRVGVYQVATARADLVHNDGHKLERLAPPDVRNRTRINALVNNASTNFIYCVPEPDGGGAGVDGAAAQPLGDVIGEILGRVFHTGDGVVGMGGLGGIGVGFRAAGRTQFFGVTSGGDGADTQNLFTSEGISISNTYSNVHDIHPSQGIFTFYATSLYHTEPKALNELMRLMALPGAPQIRDAIIISRKPMCSCCSRLILNFMNAHRNDANFPNILVMSQAQWRQMIVVGDPFLRVVSACEEEEALYLAMDLDVPEMLNQIIAIIRRVFTTDPGEPQNDLAFFIRYQ